MSELMSAEQVQNALGQLALSEATTKEQMGILTEGLKKEKIERLALDNREAAHYEEFVQDREKRRQNERIEETDAKEYHVTMDNRITDLLRSRNRMDLFGRFKSKCWIDAKKHSYMVGDHGISTKKMYHSDVIEYLGTWIPQGWGVDGYIGHLDRIKENKR